MQHVCSSHTTYHAPRTHACIHAHSRTHSRIHTHTHAGIVCICMHKRRHCLYLHAHTQALPASTCTHAGFACICMHTRRHCLHLHAHTQALPASACMWCVCSPFPPRGLGFGVLGFSACLSDRVCPSLCLCLCRQCVPFCSPALPASSHPGRAGSGAYLL